jgi:DUF218 domain
MTFVSTWRMVMTEIHTPSQLAEITNYVDVAVPPPGPGAHFIFGTNQVIPVVLVVDRYQDGLAPLIIVTGGVNRHSGVVEGQEFRRALAERGIPADVVRCEDRSASTWQNVEFSQDYLKEAMNADLPVVAVCKWYHRRAIHCLQTLLPDLDTVYAITYEPVYSGMPITRENWFDHPDGRRRVLREWHEVPRRVADGTLVDVDRDSGAWRR